MEKVMLEQILEEENIAEALEDLKSKNNNCGSDGVMITELPSYWEINKKRIIKDLLGGDYQPGVVKNTEIVDYKNKRRMITILNSVDRLILRAILQKLRPVLDGKLLPCCYAFREGKGVKEAVEKTCEYLNEGCSYMAKTDIKDFFDNIDLTHMTGILDGLIHDTALARLLKKFLYVKVDDSGKISEKRKGLIQGSPLSPVFSNLYLTTFDRQIQAEGYNYCRFSDDIAIFTKTKDDAEEAFARTRQLLKEEHDLDVNVKKSGVFETLHQIYLGYRFVKEKRKKTIIAVKNRRSFDRSYDHWYTDCIKKTDRNYHIINNGILTKRDYTLLFENGSGKKYIPVENILNIVEDITII